MKRILTLLTALVLLAGLAMPGSAETMSLVNWEGFSVTIQDYKVYKSTNSAANLYLYARVVNDTDRRISMWLDDATVDGVSVMVVPILGVEPHSDTGESEPVEIYVFASKENKDAASSAISAARELRGTLVLRDGGSGDELIRQKVSVELAGLEGIRIVNTPTPAPTPKPTPTPKADVEISTGRAKAPAYTPASWDFKTLQKGSKGQAVRDLQQRLTDLGFLNDKVDGVYGLNTATAVRSFCDQHGLTISGEASPEMQELLYSSRAEYYVEPWIPLVIGPEYKWDNPMNARDDIGMFYVQLVNRSHRDIRGYELYYYFINTWGDKIDIDTQAGSWRGVAPETNIIKSGYTEYSGSIPIHPFAYTYAVYVGIHKIVFSDGEIREIDPDDVVYFECPVKQ